MLYGSHVLVAGGAGFVGANLVKKLVEMGLKVRATVHRKEAVIKDDRIEYVRCNLTRPDDCSLVCQDIDVVFLCAAVTAGAGMMESKPLFLLTPNLMINAQMLEAAYQAGVSKTLFLSSSTVYPLTDYPVKEDDVTYQFYEKYFIAGWMKRFSEIMCEMYSTKINRPMCTIVVRPSNLYGPLDSFDWETSHVLPALIRRVVERHDPIRVWGDGKDIKDFIYIDDFIEGLLLAMEKIHSFEHINIASGNQYCLSDLLELMLRIDGYENARIEYDPTKPSMIPKRVMDTAKARNLLGFEAKTSIEAGLAKTMSWYRSVS